MTAVFLGLAWAAVVVGGLGRARPRVNRVHALGSSAPAPLRVGPAALLGAALLRVVRRDASAAGRAHRMGRAAIAFVVPLAVIRLPLGAVVAVSAAVVMWSLPVVEQRRAQRQRLMQIQGELPEVVDLLVLAVGAGLTVPLALDAVAKRAPGELAFELGRVVGASHQGHRLADALDALPARAGEGVRPLVAALVASERYGAPLAAGLERLASEVRASRRRRADEIARRVSVKLLFPLVLCILPAFALLTVAPLIASALRSLAL